MKVRCDIVLDLDTGDYEMKLNNLSQPGAPMDYLRIRAALDRVIGAVDAQSAADAQRFGDAASAAAARSLTGGTKAADAPARPKPRRR